MHVNEKSAGAAAPEPISERANRPGGIRLNDQTKGRLGLHLRAMYDELIAQPVPDRFKDLIARLDDPAAQKDAS